jgi:hypothetical protein
MLRLPNLSHVFPHLLLGQIPIPILRFISAILTLAFVYLATCRLNLIPPLPPPHFTSPDRIEYGKKPPPKYQYTPPHDLVLPKPPEIGLAAESLIGKVTIQFNGKDPTLLNAIRSHELHNQIFGYPLLILRHGLIDGGGPVNFQGVWNKPAYILAILLEEMRKQPQDRLRWLFWHDADTILLNPNIPLSFFLPPEGKNIHMLLTRDPHGLNNGVFFLRVHPWSIILFSTLLSFTLYNSTAELPYRDQSALEILLMEREEFKGHWVEVPQRWFNAYAAELSDDWTHKFQVRRGDLLVHFAGWSAEEREKKMPLWLERANGMSEPGEWNLALEKTSLRGEVRQFWDDWKKEREQMEKKRGKVVEEAELMLRNVESWEKEFEERVGEREKRIVEGKRKELRVRMDDMEGDAGGEKLRVLMGKFMEVGPEHCDPKRHIQAGYVANEVETGCGSLSCASDGE